MNEIYPFFSLIEFIKSSLRDLTRDGVVLEKL